MRTLGTDTLFSAKTAHEAQLRMSRKIIATDTLPSEISLVAGVDVAYYREYSIGAVAVLNYRALELVESQTTICRTSFPYVPTLLTFREVPPAIASIRKLVKSPDAFLIDGQGYAHPYRCGFASHLGLLVNKPTIGVAKSRLVGDLQRSQCNRGVSFLEHEGEVVCAVVPTKRGCRPIYVSVGHLTSLERAVEVVRHCTRNHRIPEPILMAHRIAHAEKRKINNALATNG